MLVLFFEQGDVHARVISYTSKKHIYVFYFSLKRDSVNAHMKLVVFGTSKKFKNHWLMVKQMFQFDSSYCETVAKLRLLLVSRRAEVIKHFQWWLLILNL